MNTHFAFIDMQNIHLGTQDLGFVVDWEKMFIYLQKKHKVTTVFAFLGYISSNKKFYKKLKHIGYTLVFKEVIVGKDGKSKGNVDAELVLEAVDRINEYQKGILISGDGDFLCLIHYWKKHNKDCTVIAASPKSTSFLLKKHLKGNLFYLQRMKHLLTKNSTRINSSGLDFPNSRKR